MNRFMCPGLIKYIEYVFRAYIVSYKVYSKASGLLNEFY